MDSIASEAGVSKLTVYSHFTDKETLFAQAIRANCEEQMPDTLFDVDQHEPLPLQLEAIARAYFALITTPEAVALHRLLIAGGGLSQKLVRLFLEAGPQRLQGDLEEFLHRHVRSGQLEITDVGVAARQFFTLLKGDLHARMLYGCCEPVSAADVDAHIEATVALFLRAYRPLSSAEPRVANA